jgi:predicted transcriptional regulator
MTIKDVRDLLEAEVLCGEDRLDEEIKGCFASDFMSDILAFARDQNLLITGMLNPQVIRTAEMVDMPFIVFVRGKRPSQDMIELAEESGMVLLASRFRMYSACGILFMHDPNTKPCKTLYSDQK